MPADRQPNTPYTDQGHAWRGERGPTAAVAAAVTAAAAVVTAAAAVTAAVTAAAAAGRPGSGGFLPYLHSAPCWG